MRYIGPFFRMNSLSRQEICGQLFYLSKEAIKTIVLNSKCGYIFPARNTKNTSSTKDISILSKFSPLLCIYKKSSPEFVHSKSSYGFNTDSFKREINPSTNALMTLCLLELSDYYSFFSKESDEYKLSEAYRVLANNQLDFYYENLRNSEGIFVSKKNTLSTSSKGNNLIDKDRKFVFSDQAFMMNAYYLFSTYSDNEETSKEYENFAMQILQMFKDYKEALYNLSFEEGCKTLLAFNIFFEYSKNSEALPIIIDLSEFLCNKFNEKDYFKDSIDCCALFSINLMYSYEHTNLITFKEKYIEIINKLSSLYDEDTNTIQKLTDKKEIKYSAFDICFYFLAIIMFSSKLNCEDEYKPMVSKIYKKYILNSNLVTSWPEAPTLDDKERYKNFTLLSKDMIDETFFRMPNLPTPGSIGVSPIFLKDITYSRKKDDFSSSRKSFDSNKNMYLFFSFIHILKDNYYSELNLSRDKITDNINTDSNNDLDIKEENNVITTEVVLYESKNNEV